MNPRIAKLTNGQKDMLAAMANTYGTSGGPYLDGTSVVHLTDAGVRDTLVAAHLDERVSGRGHELLDELERALHVNTSVHAATRIARRQSEGDQPNDPPGYAKRVRELEREGLTTSDAQGVADLEFGLI